jgi:uncharacterized protein
MTLRDRTLAYLQNHQVATLATSGPEGVWAAAVFYVNDGFTLYFLSSPTSRHSLNLAACPRIAATIQEDYEDWRDIKGIQMEGIAVRIEGRDQVTAMAGYTLKFPVIRNALDAPAEILKALARIAWYRIQPTRLYFIDNSLGLGHGDEVPL